MYILRQILRTLVPKNYNFLTYGPENDFFTDRYCCDQFFCLCSTLQTLDHFGVIFYKLSESIDPSFKKLAHFYRFRK